MRIAFIMLLNKILLLEALPHHGFIHIFAVRKQNSYISALLILTVDADVSSFAGDQISQELLALLSFRPVSVQTDLFVDSIRDNHDGAAVNSLNAVWKYAPRNQRRRVR